MKVITKDNLTGDGNLPTIKLGVYGAPGQGKTTLLGGFASDPRTGPALWLDCGGNPQLVVRSGFATTVLTMETATDILAPLDYLLGGQNNRHQFYRDFGNLFPDEPFKSLIIDTFSDWQGLLIDKIVGIDSSNLSRYSIMNVEAPSPTKHGKEIAQRTLFAARQMLLALDMNIFVAFQEHEGVEFEAGAGGSIASGSKKNKIALWGQSRMRIPAWLNLMGRMYWERQIVEEEVEVRGRKTTRQVGVDKPVIKWVDSEAHVKNQIAPSLGTGLVDPTAKQILNLIEQDYSQGE